MSSPNSGLAKQEFNTINSAVIILKIFSVRVHRTIAPD